MDNLTYSFVIPIYNEEKTIPELFRRTSEISLKLDGAMEVILIDDGSRDKSYGLMLELSNQDPRFKVIHFARNFGHQIAITAGMDFARGDAIIIMDADLQDPPEVVLQMIDQWKEGYEVVYAIRKAREGESWFKKITASLFYRILKSLTEVDIPVDVGDFRLVDRKALEAFKALRENNRFVRGMFGWIGFRQTGIYYTRAERFAGETKYTLKKMLLLAKNGVISFSNAPLKLVLNFGFLISGLSFLMGIIAVITKLSGQYTVSGWTSMTVLITFTGGVQLIVLGILGEYIGRIHDEVKNRPLYIVKAIKGFDKKISKNTRVFVPDSPRETFIEHNEADTR